MPDKFNRDRKHFNPGTHTTCCNKSPESLTQLFPTCHKQNIPRYSSVTKHIFLSFTVTVLSTLDYYILTWSEELYIIAIRRRIFLGSILDDLWCRVRPSEVSAAFVASFLGGAVTGRVGKEVDQKGSKALRNLWWNGPALSKMKFKLTSYNKRGERRHVKF